MEAAFELAEQEIELQMNLEMAALKVAAPITQVTAVPQAVVTTIPAIAASPTIQGTQGVTQSVIANTPDTLSNTPKIDTSSAS